MVDVKLKLIGIILMVLVSVMALGCIESQPSAPTSINPTEVQNEDSSNFLLSLKDLPLNESWTIEERGERNVNDIKNPRLLDDWSGGYYIYFDLSENDKVAHLDQYLSIYPEQKILERLNTDSSDWEYLNNPSIGEHSRAFKLRNSTQGTAYTIVFVKNNLLVALTSWGAKPDYLKLKELAQKAYNKIDGYGKPFAPQPNHPTSIDNQNIFITYSAEKVNLLGQVTEPKQGYVFLVITMNIENHGYKEFQVSPYSFDLVANNIKYKASGGSYLLDDKLDSVDILDGGSVKGSIAFEVPSNIESYQLQYNYFGDYQIIYKVT